MKSFRNFLTLFAAATAMIFMTSCGEDDIVIDPGTGGINVANGFYITAAGTDPAATALLSAETVEDDGFASQDRAGFVAGYIYLTNGTYNIVEITDKEKTATFGATAETITDMGSGCDKNDYILVKTVADGAGFSVPASGLYKVTYDQGTSEVVLYQIETAGLIGSATANGWGGDTDLPGTITAEGATFSGTGVELREGEFKIRFNCRWNLDRRVDPAAGFAFDNGYQFFTNFGGSTDELLTGNDGANIQITEAQEGVYTVDVNWSPVDGFSIELTKTGDVTPITFVPDEHQWALTGDATPNGWANDDPADDPIGVDHDLNYEGVSGGTYTWMLASIALVEGGMKFRANDKWDENMGWGGKLTLTGDTSEFEADGENIKVKASGAGSYKIVLTTSDDGDTYTADFEKL